MPERATEIEGSDAFEVSERFALAAPAAVGVKVTDKPAVAPAVKAYGKVKPLTVNPAPDTAADEILRVDAPVFDTVRTCVWLVPTNVLPRFMLDVALR